VDLASDGMVDETPRQAPSAFGQQQTWAVVPSTVFQQI
jgi:hypothetical protein